VARRHARRTTTSRNDTRTLTAVDLFSGCGGLTLGLELAGFRVIAGVELDALSVSTYRVNHPNVRVWDKDIRTVDPAELLKDRELQPGELDLLAGCPPCQGFSTIRTRRTMTAADDPRNELVAEFLRFATILQPKAVMLENVPGLAAYDGFLAVTQELRALGFDCKYDIFDAAHFGVPQRRKRLVLLGTKKGIVLFPERDPRQRTVRDALAGLPAVGNSGDPLHDVTEQRTPRIVKMLARIPNDGGSRSSLPDEFQLECHRECSGFRDVYGRMAWDAVAPTITTGCINPSKGRFLHPDQPRAITPREAALLQSFPRTYHFSLERGKYGAARLIGNAFPPEFARRHAAGIAQVLHEDQ
jgi:DNA (cytosine-5)-methyltransferase 1